MKIDSSYKPSTANVVSKQQPKAQTPAPAQAQEAVSLSPLAGNVASNGPPVNAARIQEIKQAISEGRFKINPEAVADSLIESTRDLLKHDGQRSA